MKKISSSLAVWIGLYEVLQASPFSPKMTVHRRQSHRLRWWQRRWHLRHAFQCPQHAPSRTSNFFYSITFRPTVDYHHRHRLSRHSRHRCNAVGSGGGGGDADDSATDSYNVSFWIIFGSVTLG